MVESGECNERRPSTELKRGLTDAGGRRLVLFNAILPSNGCSIHAADTALFI